MISPWLGLAAVVAAAGYFLCTLLVIPSEYETQTSSVRFVYWTWMALQGMVAIFVAKFLLLLFCVEQRN